ncbi:hypothetical protein ACNS7O_04325 [Haloferacaceae archaeon DSL9]
MPPRRSESDASVDPFGFDDSGSTLLTRGLRALVPQWLGRRALAVGIETDRDVYEREDPIEITIRIRNRLPLPIVVETTTQQTWLWAVDGLPAASDEVVYRSETPGGLELRGGETKAISRTWDGRFKRVGDRTRWEAAEPGDHSISARVAVAPTPKTATTTVTIRD